MGRPKLGWDSSAPWLGVAVRKPRGSTAEGGLGRPKLGWDSSAPWLGGAVRKPRGLTSEGGLGRPKLGWGTSTAWVGVLSVKKKRRCVRKIFEKKIDGGAMALDLASSVGRL